MAAGLILCGQGFLIGCNRAAHRGRESGSPPAANAAAAGKNPPLILTDGFENGALADFWLPGNYGSGLYVPGAIKCSTNYARSGRYSVEITVREGDVEQAGDAFTRVERAELDSGHFALREKEAWYAFSLM